MNPVPKVSTIPGFLPPDVLGRLISLMLGPRAMPIPMNAAGSSSTGPAFSGNLEMKLGEAASPLPFPVPLGPLDVDGRPSAVVAASGADRIGGVHSPPAWLFRVGSRDGASGEKLKLRLSGAGTLARVNLVTGSLFAWVWDGSDVGGRAELISPAGDASDQFAESGVGGPILVELKPKSKLKPVSITGFGRACSAASSVGAGLAWFKSRLKL